MINSGKQQLLAFLLIMVVLFLTPKYMEYISPQTESTSIELIEEDIKINKEIDEDDYKDLDNIKELKEELETKWHGISSKLYEQSGSSGEEKNDEGVEDTEFEEVD